MKFLFLACLCTFVLAISANAAPVIKVSAVQMRSVADLRKNVAKICDRLETLANQGVQIAVFPECALTSYDADVIRKTEKADLEKAINDVAAACKKNKINAILGTPTIRPDGKLFNSALVIDSQGKVIERYHKVHLAEDWPERGDHLALFDIAGTKGTIIICHDERYPELARLPVMAGARIIFYISSESGITAESKLVPYRAQIQARAVENCVWVVHANPPANEDATGSHGQSRIIKPDGNIVREASIFGEDVVTADLDIARAGAEWPKNSLENCEFLKRFWETGLAEMRGKE